VLGSLVAVSRELGRVARPQLPEPGDIDARYVALGALLILEERAAGVVRTAAKVGRTVGKPMVAAAAPITPAWVRRDAERLVRHLAEHGRAAADTGAGEAVEIVEVLATEVTQDPTVIALIEAFVDRLQWHVVDSILPVAIDRLAADERVRQLVQEQSRGMVDDITETARTKAADGDEAVDRFVSRLFRRRAEPATPSRDVQPAQATPVTEP
jgi:hypothetical protein